MHDIAENGFGVKARFCSQILSVQTPESPGRQTEVRAIANCRAAWKNRFSRPNYAGCPEPLPARLDEHEIASETTRTNTPPPRELSSMTSARDHGPAATQATRLGELLVGATLPSDAGRTLQLRCWERHRGSSDPYIPVLEGNMRKQMEVREESFWLPYSWG